MRVSFCAVRNSYIDILVGYFLALVGVSFKMRALVAETVTQSLQILFSVVCLEVGGLIGEPSVAYCLCLYRTERGVDLH